MAINALRNGCGLIAFGALVAVIGGARPTGEAALLLMASGAMGFAIGDALFFAALPRCGVQTAAMVGLINVPIAVLMGWVWLDQALSPAVLGSMAVVLAGVGLVLTERGSKDEARSRTSGVLLALVAAVFWASSTISGHAAIQGVDPFVGAVVRLAGALIACFGMSIVVGLVTRTGVRRELDTLTTPMRRRSMFLVLLPAVLFASIFNLVPFHFALRELPGAVGALLFSTTPLFTLPLARYFGETVGPRTLLGTLVGFAGVAGVVFLGEARVPAGELEVTALTAAGSPGARWPDLALGPDGRPHVLYTLPGPRPRLELTGLGAEGEWTAPETLAVGSEWFVNWADFPQLAFAGGKPVATWLEKLSEGIFAYGIRLREGDAPDRWLHGDASPTEHGFVSLVPLVEGGTFATWLDGRRTAEGGPMTLRGRRLGSEEFELDDRVCDCCQTGAAQLADGRVLVAWRDRSDGEEIRDISWSVGDPGEASSFSEPHALNADGWRIEGCPVNGPAVAADAQRAAVAWYTEADDDPRVQIAWFVGETFAAPRRIDEGSPLGRVDACFLGGQLCVTWLERTGTGAAWRARLVSEDGDLGDAVTLGEVMGERTDGFLRLVSDGDQAWAAFVDRDLDGIEVRHLRRR